MESFQSNPSVIIGKRTKFLTRFFQNKYGKPKFPPAGFLWLGGCRILTLDSLMKRGRPLANRCFVHANDLESPNYLLLFCNEIRILWVSAVTLKPCCYFIVNEEDCFHCSSFWFTWQEKHKCFLTIFFPSARQD